MMNIYAFIRHFKYLKVVPFKLEGKQENDTS